MGRTEPDFGWRVTVPAYVPAGSPVTCAVILRSEGALPEGGVTVNHGVLATAVHFTFRSWASATLRDCVGGLGPSAIAWKMRLGRGDRTGASPHVGSAMVESRFSSVSSRGRTPARVSASVAPLQASCVSTGGALNGVISVPLARSGAPGPKLPAT